MSDDLTDKAPHIEHRVLAEKPYEVDHAPGVDCYDHFEGVVHGKADADALVLFLREHGYKVKLVRISNKYLVDDTFATEREEGA